MAEFILKDRYGKEKTFDKETIYVRGTDGELMPFTHGAGNPVTEPLTITENGTYTAPAGVDGYNPVTVNIPDPTKTVVLEEGDIPGFAYVEDSGLSLYMLPTLSPAPFALNEGETYYVRWDGTEYECVASSVEGMVLIGNGGILGLSSTGEPFAALYDPTRNALDVVTSQEGESHTVGIWKKVKTEFKLQDITVEENGKYTADADYDGLGEVTVAVPAPEINLQDKTITENGEYTADEGFDGLGKVTVDVVSGSSSDDLKYVTFMSYDGAMEYGKKAVAVGDDCADPIARGIFATPTRESDAQYNYTFYGWATTPNGGAVSNWNKAITEDKTVYANFSKAVRYYTITYYDSDGTAVLKTESLVYGAMPSYAPEKDGYKFNGWVPELASVAGNASYTAQWIESVAFADMSWATIASYAEAGTASSVFNLGDYKPLTFTHPNGKSYTVNMVISGFDHDTLENGGKAGISFISDIAVAADAAAGDGAQKHDASRNGYWSNCTLRTSLNGSALESFPEELQSAIKPVQKISRYYDVDTSKVVATPVWDKVWIPSVYEIGLTYTDSYGGIADGTAYSHYIREKYDENNVLAKYHLRTNTLHTYSYTYDSAGKKLSTNDMVNYRRGLVIGFCI